MDLLRHERLKKEEDYKKLDKMRNPKVKKNDNMVLHPDTLRARFQALGPTALDLYPITLDKGSQDLMVSRDFMAAEYGGSMQATCPSIGKRLVAKHGMDDFMYLHPAYQPVAPQVPGACGLFLTTGTSVGLQWESLVRLFTRIDSNVWQYMGMYRLTSSPSLTKREWADQDPKVQRTWGRELCRQQWGGDVRARIFARKRLGREPTKKEFEELSEEGSPAHSVTPEEVMAAFTKGEETLAIWLMQCVGYDNAFQLDLCAKFPLWVPPPRKARGSGKSSAKKSKAAAVRAGRKRKREESPDQQEEEEHELDELSEDSGEDLTEEVLTYKPRGTRSRPIYI
ncbi:hypothetical protein BYT27DRAFT_7230127 [Phlegmacium glaucopus]|nr:hypothetical protein BYT27DRAFT_7230127 [Phlegmacium glaucopus]